MNDHHQVGRGFPHRHAMTHDVFGQTRLRDRDAILHEHLRLIDVDPGLEHDVDRKPAVAGRLRGDVEHVVNAVDLLLDRRRDGCRDDFGRGARIDRVIFTVGGAISGYSEIGSDLCAMAPAIVRRIERTAAKIGRSMKKWENRIAILGRHGLVSSTAAAMTPSCGATGHPAARTDWRFRRSRPDRFGKARQDDAQAFIDLAELTRLTAILLSGLTVNTILLA